MDGCSVSRPAQHCQDLTEPSRFDPYTWSLAMRGSAPASSRGRTTSDRPRKAARQRGVRLNSPRLLGLDPLVAGEKCRAEIKGNEWWARAWAEGRNQGHGVRVTSPATGPLWTRCPPQMLQRGECCHVRHRTPPVMRGGGHCTPLGLYRYRDFTSKD